MGGGSPGCASIIHEPATAHRMCLDRDSDTINITGGLLFRAMTRVSGHSAFPCTKPSINYGVGTQHSV